MKEVKLYCDIKDGEHDGEVREFFINVIFDHDQEDGKSKCEPYFDNVKIHICDNCWKYIMENMRYIYAYGAMGHNTYYLKVNAKLK